MGESQATIEYAVQKRDRARLPARLWAVGLVALSVVGFFVPAAEMDGTWWSGASVFAMAFSSVRGGDWWTALVMGMGSVNLAMGPVLLYFVWRAGWGGVRRVERWAGYGVRVLCALPMVGMGMLCLQVVVLWVVDRKVAIIFLLIGGLAMTALALGSWVALRIGRSHREGTAIVAFLMGCYMANVVYALGFLLLAKSLRGWDAIRPGAAVCVAVAVGYGVYLVVLDMKDMRWRQGLGISVGAV